MERKKSEYTRDASLTLRLPTVCNSPWAFVPRVSTMLFRDAAAQSKKAVATKRNTKVNVASAGVGLCLLLVVFDASQLSERAEKRAYAMKHGLPCMALVDPTVGAYAGRPELSLLRLADAQGARYMVADQVTVTELDSAACDHFLAPVKSSNPVGTNAIFLNTDRLTTPAARAVGLSHELVHVRHSDPTSLLGRHTLLRHLWMSEEGEAHLRALETARALHAPLLYPAWQDYLFWIYTLPLSYLFFAIVAVWILYKVRNQQARGPRISPTEQPQDADTAPHDLSDRGLKAALSLANTYSQPLERKTGRWFCH